MKGASSGARRDRTSRGVSTTVIRRAPGGSAGRRAAFDSGGRYADLRLRLLRLLGFLALLVAIAHERLLAGWRGHYSASSSLREYGRGDGRERQGDRLFARR